MMVLATSRRIRSGGGMMMILPLLVWMMVSLMVVGGGGGGNTMMVVAEAKLPMSSTPTFSRPMTPTTAPSMMMTASFISQRKKKQRFVAVSSKLRGGGIGSSSTTIVTDALANRPTRGGGGEASTNDGFGVTDILWMTVYGAFLAFIVIACNSLTRTGGEAPTWLFGLNLLSDTKTATILMHVTYFVVGLLLLPMIVPDGLKKYLFSPFTVTVLGYVYPAIESVKAAVTDDSTLGKGVISDDRTWLMYWVIQGIFQYSTEFMDQLSQKSALVYKYWHTFEVLAVIWLIVPITDGSTLIYNNIAIPYLLPFVTPIKSYCDGWIATIALTTINASYIWWFAFIFMSLPVLIKRYAVIGVGSIFPLLSTIMALTTTTASSTPEMSKEVMRWLTYWPCFSFLFLIMIGIEKFLGSFKGLYVACLAATMYLMLPMFDGSTLVFRNILIPLLGQQELLLIRDAKTLALNFIKQLPTERQQIALQNAANAFATKATA